MACSKTLSGASYSSSAHPYIYTNAFPRRGKCTLTRTTKWRSILQDGGGVANAQKRRKKKGEGEQVLLSLYSKYIRDAVDDDEKVRRPKVKLKGGIEGSLRLKLMDDLMTCASNADCAGAASSFRDLLAAGLVPGPRSYHGLVVSHTLCRDIEGTMQSLRKEINSGIVPLQETFIAITRLLGSTGNFKRGEQVLGAMEDLKLDISKAWVVFVEELFKGGFHKEASRVFLEVANEGVRAPDYLYDFLIEENCKLGDHANAIEIAENMESHGRMATTYHYNCLLSVQAKSGIPEIPMGNFEDMYYGEEYMKPDTESYNWIFEALVRDTSQDRLLDVVDHLGTMIEDHRRVQPNPRTYTLLIECLTKYIIVTEAIRHFRALKTYPGGMKLLYNNGSNGDPLSLYLRMLCRDGRIVEMLDAFEAMIKDNQPITPRAMIVDRKGRTLVSSWIEPIQQEANIGFQVDYIERYIAEGGLTGERKRWVPHRDMEHHIDPDAEGFFYTYPSETSYKERCGLNLQAHYMKLLKKIKSMGVAALGEDATESDVANVMEALKNKIENGFESTQIKPKAAYKMAISELRAELEGQELPTDGNKQALYQRVIKARKENEAEGRPLWIPPASSEEPETTQEAENLISRLEASLVNDNTEYWRKKFLEMVDKADNPDNQNPSYDQIGLSMTDDTEDVILDPDSNPDFEAEDIEEDEVIVEDEEVDANEDEEVLEEPQVEEKLEFYVDLSIPEKCKLLKERGIFDVDDMYRIEDAWGWTWEKHIRAKVPEQWTQENEVHLALQIMEKVIELGGKPTIGDCAMILRAAIRAPIPSAIISILRKTHELGYAFGSPLYEEVITLCIDLEEMDAAVAIVADLQSAGINVPNETIDKVLQQHPLT